MSVDEILEWIHTKQGTTGTGNPEGYTEIHSYHVWEVLNAIKEIQK